LRERTFVLLGSTQTTEQVFVMAEASPHVWKEIGPFPRLGRTLDLERRPLKSLRGLHFQHRGLVRYFRDILRCIIRLLHSGLQDRFCYSVDARNVLRGIPAGYHVLRILRLHVGLGCGPREGGSKGPHFRVRVSRGLLNKIRLSFPQQKSSIKKFSTQPGSRLERGQSLQSKDVEFACERHCQDIE
jgi:hypothetical protein